jgi:hypothetical protein
MVAEKQIGAVNIDVAGDRFKLDEKIVAEITKFAQNHAGDERKVFQKHWCDWIDQNKEMIDGERQRLKSLGFRGDPVDKMYKSARYYFRNKPSDNKMEDKPEAIARKQYVASSKELLELMNRHIVSNIESDNFTPASGFTEFCQQNIEALRKEIALLQSRGETDALSISHKFKKTYKNRYYQVSRSLGSKC